MSTVTLPESTTTATQPATQGWIPSPLYRFTLERYEELVESGAFSKQDRFHLINLTAGGPCRLARPRRQAGPYSQPNQ
jgi:hypothetical protein